MQSLQSLQDDLAWPTGPRYLEDKLVVPGCFKALSNEKALISILKNELEKKASKHLRLTVNTLKTKNKIILYCILLNKYSKCPHSELALYHSVIRYFHIAKCGGKGAGGELQEKEGLFFSASKRGGLLERGGLKKKRT